MAPAWFQLDQNLVPRVIKAANVQQWRWPEHLGLSFQAAVLQFMQILIHRLVQLP